MTVEVSENGCEQVKQHVCRDAQNDSCGCGEDYGSGGPFQASGLVVNGQAGSGAGPVKQTEDHQAYGGGCRPPVGREQGRQGGQFFHLHQTAGLQIGHEYNGKDDLVGGKSQDKRRQNDAVQPHKAAQRIQKAGENFQQAGGSRTCGAEPSGSRPGKRDVCQDPDDEPGGGGHCGGPAQDKQGPVQHGTHQDFADLRAAVGRQLQGEGGGDSPQQGVGQKPGDRQGHENSGDQGPGEHEGGGQGGANSGQGGTGCQAGISGQGGFGGSQAEVSPGKCTSGQEKKQGDHGKQGGQAAVAGDKSVGENGQQPLPGGVNDAAADDAGGVAAQTHGHGQTLFSAGSAFLKCPIHIEGGPGQVSQIFQQGKERKENGHGREHNGYDPGENPANSVYQAVHRRGGGAQEGEEGGQLFFPGKQQVPEQGGWVVGSRHGDPEDA